MAHQSFQVRLSDGRRVVLPAEVCKQLGIDVGDTVIVDVDDGKVQLHSFDTRLATFRAELSNKVPPGVSLVDELLAERREEVRRE
ncbi:MAG TPA: AbrB/MazE/SpoVT family DNA-binding domain-containing protein [Pirellulales bacterium]|nr:AbrB/MazE/SpoVT family DNA-binding domain-containing protein [Pirellulales bacterium]